MAVAMELEPFVEKDAVAQRPRMGRKAVAAFAVGATAGAVVAAACTGLAGSAQESADGRALWRDEANANAEDPPSLGHEGARCGDPSDSECKGGLKCEAGRCIKVRWSGIGENYNGTLAVAQGGKPCLRWDARRRYDGKVNDYWAQYAEKLKTASGGAHNYCRNPDKSIHGPWCLTSMTTWQPDYPFYGVSYCGGEASIPTTTTGFNYETGSTTTDIFQARPECGPLKGKVMSQEKMISESHMNKFNPYSDGLEGPGFAQCSQKCLDNDECESISYWEGKGACHMYRLKNLTGKLGQPEKGYNYKYWSMSRGCLQEGNIDGRALKSEGENATAEDTRAKVESAVSKVLGNVGKAVFHLGVESVLAAVRLSSQDCEMQGRMQSNGQIHVPDVTSIADCRQACLNHRYCKSISYRDDTNKCVINKNQYNEDDILTSDPSDAKFVTEARSCFQDSSSSSSSSPWEDLVSALEGSGDDDEGNLTGRALKSEGVNATAENATAEDRARLEFVVSKALPLVGKVASKAVIHLAVESALAAARLSFQACEKQGRIPLNAQIHVPEVSSIAECRRECLGHGNCESISYRFDRRKCFINKNPYNEDDIITGDRDDASKFVTEARSCFQDRSTDADATGA